jgi:hypothetical protein
MRQKVVFICNIRFKIFIGKWRPRRSIVFGSWGAEEYGIIGVTEWVEVRISLN